MPTINPTLVATSDPVDLCKGFALFPGVGTFRAAVSTKGGRYHLLSIAPSCPFGRLRVSVDYDIFAGICGPAYGFSADLSGSHDANGVQLTVGENMVAAGMQMGLVLTPTIDIAVDRPDWTWMQSGWFGYFDWLYQEVFHKSFSLPLDIISILSAAIEYILGKTGNESSLLKRVNSLAPNLISSWGMYAESRNQLLVGNDAEVTVEPKFMLQFNIVPLVPALQAIDTSMKAVLGTIRLGPTLGPSIPTTVKVTKVGVNGTLQPTTAYDRATKTITGSGGATATAATTVNVELRHTAGFDVRVGLFFTIKVLKLLGTTVENDIGILRLFGVTVNGAPRLNTLQSAVGTRPTATRAAHDEPDAPDRQIRVVFGPPMAEPA